MSYSREQLAGEGIQWRFNPSAAPHFGGLWEAAIKVVKHHLRRAIGETTLTFEEMSILLSEIEACLNSRPLQALSDDPADLMTLTPGHFLIGSALTVVPEPSLLEEPIKTNAMAARLMTAGSSVGAMVPKVLAHTDTSTEVGPNEHRVRR